MKWLEKHLSKDLEDLYGYINYCDYIREVPCEIKGKHEE